MSSTQPTPQHCLIEDCVLKPGECIRSENGWFELRLDDTGSLQLVVLETPIVMWEASSDTDLEWRRIRNDGVLEFAGAKETRLVLKDDGNLVYESDGVEYLDGKELREVPKLKLWSSDTAVYGPNQGKVGLDVVVDCGKEATIVVTSRDSSELSDINMENGLNQNVTVVAGERKKLEPYNRASILSDSQTFAERFAANSGVGEESHTETSIVLPPRGIARVSWEGKPTLTVTRTYRTASDRHKVIVPQPWSELNLNVSFWHEDYLLHSSCELMQREEKADFYYLKSGQQYFMDRFYTSPDEFAFPDEAFLYFSAEAFHLSKYVGGFRVHDPSRAPVQQCETILVPEENELQELTGMASVMSHPMDEPRGFVCRVPITFAAFVYSMARLILSRSNYHRPPSFEPMSSDRFVDDLNAMVRQETYSGQHPLIRSLWCRFIPDDLEPTGTFERLRGLRWLNKLWSELITASVPQDVKTRSDALPFDVLKISTYFTFQHEFAHFAKPHEEAAAYVVDNGLISKEMAATIVEVFCDSFAIQATAARFLGACKSTEDLENAFDDLFIAIVLSHFPLLQNYSEEVAESYPHPLARLKHVLDELSIEATKRGMEESRVLVRSEILRIRMSHALLSTSEVFSPPEDPGSISNWEADFDFDPFRAFVGMINYREYPDFDGKGAELTTEELLEFLKKYAASLVQFENLDAGENQGEDASSHEA